jgi:redox-sensitive bicupin YhaK (pirin superfamily)
MMKSVKILERAAAKKTYPTGDPSFSVMKAFPAGISAKNADPFLMADYFSRIASQDEFPIGWHPHVGMDICTYLRQGGSAFPSTWEYLSAGPFKFVHKTPIVSKG